MLRERLQGGMVKPFTRTQQQVERGSYWPCREIKLRNRGKEVIEEQDELNMSHDGVAETKL